MTEPILWVSGIFVLVGAIFALVPIIMNKSRKKRAAESDRETKATVVMYKSYRGDGCTTYAPVYSYWVNGKEYRKTSIYSSSGQKFSIGDEVVLHYKSDNPKIVFVEEEQYIVKLISVIFGIISGVMIISGMVIGIIIMIS